MKATGMYRFFIKKVLSRALDGLILTCEVKVYYEEGTPEDLKLVEDESYKKLWQDALEVCMISQKTLTPSR